KTFVLFDLRIVPPRFSGVRTPGFWGTYPAFPGHGATCGFPGLSGARLLLPLPPLVDRRAHLLGCPAHGLRVAGDLLERGQEVSEPVRRRSAGRRVEPEGVGVPRLHAADGGGAVADDVGPDEFVVVGGDGFAVGEAEDDGEQVQGGPHLGVAGVAASLVHECGEDGVEVPRCGGDVVAEGEPVSDLGEGGLVEGFQLDDVGAHRRPPFGPHVRGVSPPARSPHLRGRATMRLGFMPSRLPGSSRLVVRARHGVGSTWRARSFYAVVASSLPALTPVNWEGAEATRPPRAPRPPPRPTPTTPPPAPPATPAPPSTGRHGTQSAPTDPRTAGASSPPKAHTQAAQKTPQDSKQRRRGEAPNRRLPLILPAHTS